jgi:hypothetical protein
MDKRFLASVSENLQRQRRTLVRQVAGNEASLDKMTTTRESELEERAQEERISRVVRHLEEREQDRLRDIDVALARIEAGVLVGGGMNKEKRERLQAAGWRVGVTAPAVPGRQTRTRYDSMAGSLACRPSGGLRVSFGSASGWRRGPRERLCLDPELGHPGAVGPVATSGFAMASVGYEGPHQVEVGALVVVVPFEDAQQIAHGPVGVAGRDGIGG